MKQDLLLSSFWGANNNCVAIAFIKAMIAGRGLYKIKTGSNKLHIFLKDKTIISFTSHQIKKMNTGNGIHFRREGQQKKIRQHAEALFALLVLQLQLHGYRGQELTQSAAKKLLVSGIDTKTIHQWLGVNRTRNVYKKPDLPVIKKMPAILLFNQRHIAFASGGYFDQGGTGISFDDATAVFPFGAPTHYYKLG